MEEFLPGFQESRQEQYPCPIRVRQSIRYEKDDSAAGDNCDGLSKIVSMGAREDELRICLLVD